jgi:Neuraminidase (sialidase)
MAIKVSGTTVIDDSRNIQNVGIITATTINATTITGDGSGLTGAGSTVGIDTTTNDTFYPLFTQTTSGTVTSSSVSTSKLEFNPSTGTLTSTVLAKFGGTSSQFLKADGSIDSTEYANTGKAIAMSIVFG